MRTIALLTTSLLAVGLIFAGCGGDDEITTTSSTSTTTSSTTAATGTTGAAGDLTAQANQICAAAEDEARAAVEGLPQGTENAAVVDALAPVYQGILESIAALPGAQEDEAVTSFLEAAQRGPRGTRG